MTYTKSKIQEAQRTISINIKKIYTLAYIQSTEIQIQRGNSERSKIKGTLTYRGTRIRITSQFSLKLCN